MPPPLSHGLMTMDWLFLRLFDVVFSCNFWLLYVFRHVLLMKVSTCSMHVKKSTKMGLSEEGGMQLDFFLKWVTYYKCCCDKNIVLVCVS